MPPMVGIDDEAFDGFTEERRVGGDQIRLSGRRHEAGAKARAQRHAHQREIGGAADPAIHQKGLHVDVMLLRAVEAEELERAQAVRVSRMTPSASPCSQKRPPGPMSYGWIALVRSRNMSCTAGMEIMATTNTARTERAAMLTNSMRRRIRGSAADASDSMTAVPAETAKCAQAPREKLRNRPPARNIMIVSPASRSAPVMNSISRSSSGKIRNGHKRWDL
jgi:hypothetical protein